MKFALSTIAGLESLGKKEIEKCGGKIEKTIDRLITFSGEKELMIDVNLWSRIGNKLYLVLWEYENVTDFDAFFDAVSDIDFSDYTKNNNPIMVKATSIRSELFATRTIQSLGKKAIVTSLVWEGNTYHEDNTQEPVEILFLFINDELKVLLNTSWEALHKRGYRKDAGEAPMKENIAAALVLFSNWRCKEPFYDVFCGSGTIPIEAAMIAKNRAPGLWREFAFERLWLVSEELVAERRLKAKNKEFSWEYKIIASDIDKEVLEIARKNAKKAGVENDIQFSQKNIWDYFEKKIHWTLVSNPPYWLRLQPENLKHLYNNIDKLFRVNPELKWWVISSFFEFDSLIHQNDYKKRKLYNGAEKCYFWKRK